MDMEIRECEGYTTTISNSNLNQGFFKITTSPDGFDVDQSIVFHIKEIRKIYEIVCGGELKGDDIVE